MACELIAKCIFFNDTMKDRPTTADLMKDRYCKGDHTVCARFQVFSKMGREKVPQDLFPNQQDRAVVIIGEA